ncbi:hypothetical protein C482_04204 [Natrialba chahannaoensis JCM 10990]|uniref:Uncharacterized protein n=1 Tax=Natrialba chahannaoensis JCM 10990 TaxID=1227492 RepID=M0AYY8_9EURY|nr:hypothetical protein C482_04204 [Natrialba chahannaoensis JCM 10990]
MIMMIMMVQIINMLPRQRVVGVLLLLSSTTKSLGSTTILTVPFKIGKTMVGLKIYTTDGLMVGM